ncbi:asparagine synthase [Microbacterium sp. LRZ72]|uniref:asparagine synthase n=1 Tax=Microbacterium sp. LRZ72 TaxID=2942481 RepID=UPI0029BADB87|nr:asparagine synthase [Microbacterium sp. LRZ72]MDX2376533.1 asparagine synthase [Microbacterium sp. LRZ72]
MSPKTSPDVPEAAAAAAGAASRAKPPKLAEVVSEGIYIAAAATRLRLKNRILMETIAGGEGYDLERFIPDAREALLTLAEEAEDVVARLRRERKDAWRHFSDPDSTHDYGTRDLRNLRRRLRQSKRIAKELRLRAADEDELRRLVVAARDAAWDELALNIDRTLRIEAARPDLEPDYEQMREARMQSLRLVDLAALSSQQRRRVKARSASDDADDEQAAPSPDSP